MTRETEEQTERRLQRECSTIDLGTLGDPKGINVAKVEIQRFTDSLDGSTYEGGYFVVHAGDVEDIYAVFHDLVAEKLDRWIENGVIEGWEILDTNSF